jgi:2,4-dienoyl-CoA reductase-like NADH-dependent reductase (Old Yellow Enzyme family)/thioredoxin reductase
MALKKVFEPIRINGLELKNRVVRTAHGTFLSSTRHIGGSTWQAFHVARARGGVALTILEASYVHKSGGGASAALDDDAIIDTYRRLMTAVRPHGMRVFQQIWHGGHLYTAEGGGPSWGVSAVPSATGVMPEAMNHAQIVELQDAYVAAALRCKAGGLDGVEFHSAHGYLPSQFYSPHLNRRTDQYGGSLENRMRFTMETLRKLRTALGPDFVLGMRVGTTYMSGVYEDEIKTIIGIVEQSGLIDYLNASMGDYYDKEFTSAMQQPVGYQLPSTSQLTAVSRVPRIVVGRFRTLEEVEQVLKTGCADLVSMVRAHIADPDVVRKTVEGRVDEIRPCIACNQGCIGGLYRHGKVGCAVNPAAGFEDTLGEDLITKVDTPRRVLVVGGGPAGMEAARVAALRGHTVKLVEATNALGGMINVARRAPRLHTFGDIAHWLEHELHRLGVTVELNTYAEADGIRADPPDALIVATGSVSRRDGYQMMLPTERMQGYDLPHVISSVDLLTRPKATLGRHAVVFDDVGHMEAVAAAEYLVENGVAVTFVTSHPQFGGPYLGTTERDKPALERLYAGGFRVQVRSGIVAISSGECQIRPLQSRKVETVPADLVVLVTHNEPTRQLYEELREHIPLSFVVGDARAPRDAQYAMWEAHRVARTLP